MATDMTGIDALQLLRSRQNVSSQQFNILQAIATEVTIDADSKLSKELILRALDNIGEFYDTKEILQSLVRETGLFPYLDRSTLSVQDTLALEYHCPDGLEEDLVFHQEQTSILHKLLDGKNIVLSAPTSFGKSKIVDAILATRKFNNIVIVVPTLALIDETRRRLNNQFHHIYNIVGHPSQNPTENGNIFIFTPERVVSYKDNFPAIDFFVIDEFYKIGGQNEEDRRVVSLNEAFYILYKRHQAQFYMLGPNIEAITEGANDRFNFEFISTDYQTVIEEVVPVHAESDEERMSKLIDICFDLDEPTLIFCKSILQVNNVAESLVKAGVLGESNNTENAIDWLSKEFHSEWILPRALRSGVGIHYGPLPRALANEMVRFFNSGRIQFLVCTSTLIEGVNTKAKNVIIFDNQIAKNKLDYFTFNNIKGRSGRMFQYFIGKVFRFYEEPEAELPTVDFPIHSQTDQTPESLLIQIDREDLKDKSYQRLQRTMEYSALPLSLLKENHGIEPSDQIDLANKIISNLQQYHELLSWSNFPQYKQLLACCELIWEHWVKQSRNGIYSAKQLTLKIWKLRDKPTVAEKILNELNADPRFSAKTPNEAVERTLRFDRNWAGFDFPQYLMALHNIQDYIFSINGLKSGDYAFYATQVESLFMPEICAVLDEYGIPAILSEKYPFIYNSTSIAESVSVIKKQNLSNLDLHPYENELLTEFQNIDQ
jgi:DEAD/DEAH box helicase/Helicase conserved C-terminal domain